MQTDIQIVEQSQSPGFDRKTYRSGETEAMSSDGEDSSALSMISLAFAGRCLAFDRSLVIHVVGEIRSTACHNPIKLIARLRTAVSSACVAQRGEISLCSAGELCLPKINNRQLEMDGGRGFRAATHPGSSPDLNKDGVERAADARAVDETVTRV